MSWKMLDLFSGIGGFSLAAQWVWGDELEIVAFCEIDKFCQKVLHKHWPNVPIVEDVRDVAYARLFGQTKQEKQTTGIEQSCQTLAFSTGGESWEQTESERREDTCGGSQEVIDLLTGGFPCQPFSCAGKRKGKEDNRFLWPQMLRVIKDFKPRWIVAENVAGIVRMALDDCLSDLEGEGYTTGTQIIPACAVNAPHRRDRVWIVAHDRQQPKGNKGHGFGGQLIYGTSKGIWTEKGNRLANSSQDVADSNWKRLQGHRGLREYARQWVTWSGCTALKEIWESEPDVGRVAHGVPNRVDRLKSLGNAIVPQVAYQIMQAIKKTEQEQP